MKKILLLAFALTLLQHTLLSQQVPDFTETDCNGVTHHLYGDLAAGNAVIINFCAGWCGPCRNADPKLEEVYQDYCQGTGNVKVYGMLFETYQIQTITDCAFGQQYAADYGLNFPIFTNIGTWYPLSGLTGEFVTALGLDAIPTFYIVIPNTSDPANSQVITLVGDSYALQEEIKAVLADHGFGPSISKSGDLCSNTTPYSATLTSNFATGNLWSTGETSQSITVHTTGTYTLTHDISGCNVTTSKFIEFHPIPVAGTASVSSNTMCQGGVVILDYAPGAADAETWEYRFQGDQTWYELGPALYGPINFTLINPPGTVLIIRVKAINGSSNDASCVAYSNEVLVTVIAGSPGVAAGTASSPSGPVCPFDEITINYSGNEPNSFWEYYDGFNNRWIGFEFANYGPVQVGAWAYAYYIDGWFRAKFRVKVNNGNCYDLSNETITTLDDVRPSITCPANIVRGTDYGLCSAVVTYNEPTGSDNCSVYTYTLDLESGSVFPKGVSVVEWIAEDWFGLYSICSFTVTVMDTQAPSISCPASQTVGNTPGQCNATATYLTPTGSDNCDLPSGAVSWVSGGSVPTASGANSVSAFPKGATTVTWKVTDGAGLTKTCSFRVTVNDIQGPTFTLCPSSQSVSAATNACSASAIYATPTATDNCTFAPTVVRIGGLPSNSAFPLGTTTVIWRAIDGAGRSSTCTFTVTVTDNAPPAISCPANIVQNNPPNACNAPVMYTTPTATDNCGVNAVFLMSGAASGSAFPLGTTAVTWQANDVNGLSATCSFSVTVSCGAYRSTPFGNAAHGLSDVAQRSPGPLTVAPNGVRRYVLSPNPATEMVDVAWDGSAPDHVVVFDAQGRLVWEQATDTEARALRFDVSDWTAGVYLVSLRSGGTVVVKRLVVCKDL